jgi:uncharacterized repeat protein (TIGR03803 family)
MPRRPSCAVRPFCKSRVLRTAVAWTFIAVLRSVLSPTLPAVAQSTAEEQVIYSFSASNDCFSPLAPLTPDAEGNLYGTALGGGTSNGCVFELSPNGDGTWTEKTIHLFDVNNGTQPVAALVFDKAGNLYGTAESGGLFGAGVVFELTPIAGGEWTDSILYNFGLRRGDGVNAATEVVFGPDGSLYGATEFGGIANCGIVYKLTFWLGAWSETILHDFSNSRRDGCNPRGGVVFDSRGRLYGTTSGGGGHGFGTVYEIARLRDGSYQEHVIHNFSGTDGRQPLSTLVIDGGGGLYGTTFDGGNLSACGSGCGTVFKLTNVGGRWQERVLYAFSGSDGENVVGPVVFDLEGNLYGAAASGGGPSFNGLIFRLTPQVDGTWKDDILHKFPWPSTGDGAAPYAGFILRGGELFGTTLLGGMSNVGATVSIGR